MAFTADDLTKLQTDINNILEKINELASAATDDAKKAGIIGLIGAIIGLIITAIKAAMD